MRGEEIDLAPLLLLAMAGTVGIRYIGSGLNQIDLYILGGVGTAAFLFFRYFFCFQAQYVQRSVDLVSEAIFA